MNDEQMAAGRPVEPASLVAILRGKKIPVAVQPGQTLLGALQQAGIRPPFLCAQGICGTCIISVREGAVEMDANEALTVDEIAGGYALACQARPTSQSVTVEFL